MQTRTLGGEAGSRGMFGGGGFGKARGVSLILVGSFGAVLILIFREIGMLVTLFAAALVFFVTMKTPRGSIFARIRIRLIWRDRKKTGTTSFRHVSKRPVELEQWVPQNRQERAEFQKEWSRYRETPDGAEGMSWLQKEFRQPGIAWHTPTGEDPYLSVAFAVSGQVGGIVPDAFLDRSMMAFGALLAKQGSRLVLPNYVQSMTRVMPVDPGWHEDWAASELDPDAPVRFVKSYEQVIHRTSAAGLMPRHFIIVRWPLGNEFISRASRYAPGEEGWRMLMEGEIASAVARLTAAKLGDPRPLTARQVAAVLRHMQLPDWPIDVVGGVDVDAPWEDSDDEFSVCWNHGEGPDGEEVEWGHRTAECPIEAFETGERTSLWMAPMLTQLQARIVRTLSVHLQIVDSADARRQAQEDIVSDLSALQKLHEEGSIDDDEHRVRLKAARARAADMAPGSGQHGIGWVMHVTISAQDRRVLIDHIRKIEEAAGHAGINYLEWLDAQQSGASACTWPIARGMELLKESKSSQLRNRAAGSGHKEAIQS